MLDVAGLPLLAPGGHCSRSEPHLQPYHAAAGRSDLALCVIDAPVPPPCLASMSLASCSSSPTWLRAPELRAEGSSPTSLRPAWLRAACGDRKGRREVS
jgi:hypothetical protein